MWFIPAVIGIGALGIGLGAAAFAMLDEDSGSMYLARDPLGIKPLYFLRRQGGVIFASELKALVAAIGPELRTEPGALAYFGGREAERRQAWVMARRRSGARTSTWSPQR